jgi:RNA polymerase sigma factor (TIGR02999 family)
MAGDLNSTTRLLNLYGRGERQVELELLEAIYGHLHELAERNMRGQSPGHTLQPTALVHEAWMRIAKHEELEFDDRAQFYALASKVMRSVLVDHSRRAQREKRGGGRAMLSLDQVGAVPEQGVPSAVDILALEEGLVRLGEADPELCRLVEMRFFGGLKHEEIAEVMGVSVRTVERHWRAARAFLSTELSA